MACLGSAASEHSPATSAAGKKAMLPDVDIVIPAGCEQDSGLLNVTGMVQRDRDNDELIYTMGAIAKNAPWVHKI